jgi:hypothetical protein
MLLVASEDNIVYALDATTAHEVWRRLLGKPVARSSLRCGNIDPLGITGTPVIDETRGAIYLDAAVDGSSGPRHLVFPLSLEDGAPLPDWPVDIAATPARLGYPPMSAHIFLDSDCGLLIAKDTNFS